MGCEMAEYDRRRDALDFALQFYAMMPESESPQEIVRIARIFHRFLAEEPE
jgi:hypothetical protein